MTEDEHAPNPRFADRGTQGRAGLRSRRSRLFVLACIVLGVSASGGVAVDGAQPAPREPARADGGSSPEQASGRDARQTSEQREERRATRRRFSAQNADEALTTARHYVPPAVTRGPFRPFEDRRAVRFIGSRAAVVGTGDEQRTLMVSSAPLGVPDGEGKLVPLDLSLVRSSADFASRRQSGNLRIPVDLGDGVELGRPGLVLRPAGADQAAAGEALGGSVFYANAHVDTDFAVRPTPDGVEVFDVLRSDLSPESLRYTVDGDGEPTLRESSRHAGLTEVVRDGRVVATLAGVMATDADGVAVETTVRVADKKTLEILVPHRGKDVRYPITVDPEVTWDNYWWESYDVERHGPPGGAPTGWRWEQYVTSGAGMYPHWGTNYLGWGLHIWRDWYREPTVGEWYNRGDMGQWVYASPGDSSIGHITADYDLDLAPGEPAMCVLTGLQPANTAHDVPDMQTLGECGDEVFNRRVVHETTVDSDNQFMFRLRAPTDATRRQFAAHLQYVNIHIYDRKRPELLLSGGWTTSGHWTTSGARTVTATDTGTGVEKLELTKAPTVGTPCDSARNGDAGVYDNNCAARPLTTSHTYPEGATPVTAVAEDVVELTKTASTTFRVDATAPLNPVFTTLGARPALGPGTSGSGMHGLPVTAADDRRNAGLQGGAAADVSGARNAAVTLDGTYGADLKNAACSSSTSVNCTITGSYPIDASAASALGRDDFRPPTGTVDGRSAQIGGTWSRSSVGTDITVTTAGRIRRTQANRAWASIATPGPTADYDVGADVVSLPTAGSGNLGVLGRFTSATGNYYSAKWDNADSRWELRRVLDGQATVLGTASDTLPAGSTARLTLQMRGSTIRLLRDGAAKVTAIDAAVTAPGRAGVYFEGSTSGSDTAGRHLDNFDVTKSALTEGRHVLSAKTTDGVGKTSAGLSRDVIVDRTSPDLIVVEGTLKRTRIGRGKYTLDVTARDRGVWPDVAGMGRIDILVNGVVAHTDDRDDPGIDHTTRFEFDTATREKGSYRFDVRAYDAAKSPSSGDGNAFDEETFTVNFDDDAKPDVSLSGSATDPFNPGSQLNVAANDRINAQDGSGVEKIEVKVDGVRDGDLHERPCPNAQCPQTWELTHTLNAGAYTEGTHTVKASATDAAGNVGDSMEFAWRVDRTAPTVEHAPLEHVDGWRNEAAPTAKSRVTGRDGGGGVRSVEVTMPWETNGTIGSRTDAHPFPCASGLVSCQPAASHDFTYSPALRESGGRLPEGRLTFRARAADVGGRQSGEAIWSYRVDRGSPKLAPVTGSVVDAATHRRPVSGPEFLNVSATDGENTTDATRRAGVASAELIVDGQPLSQAVRDAMAGEQRVTQECPGDSCSLSTQLTFDPAHVAEGDHALKARVTDHAGNLTESQTYVVIVDRNAPTVEQSPVSGVAGWHRASDPDATVRVTGRDAGSGVRALTVAGPWQTSPSAPVTEGTLSHTPPCTGPAGRCPAEVTHDFTFGPGVSSAGQIPEGRNAMRATATDGGNRGSADVTWTYRVDRSAPELAPVSGSLVDAVNDGRPLSEPEVMDVSASDGANTSDASRRSGVASAELIVDGRELTQTERDSMTGEQRATQDCPADSCALATQLTFDPTELPEGDHTVKVRVIDHAGNASESQQYGLIVDRNAPTVEESPVSGVDGWNAADDADATVRVTGRDAGAGVRLLTVAGPWQTSPNASITEGTLSHAPPCPGPAGRCPTEVTHDFTFGPGTSSDGQIPEGRNTMRATATDGGGRGSADVTWTYRVDREAPSDLMVDGPLASADDRRFGSATTLNVQATDGSNATDRSARSGVEVTELLLDGEPMSDAMRAAMQGEQRHTQSCPADSCGIDTQLTFDPGALDPGVYRVKVRVTDHAGNSTESAEYIAYTDTTAPAVELSGSATQPVNPGPLLHVHADDHVGGVDGTGVQSIEVKVDGVRDGELHERTCPAAGCPQAWDLDHSLDTTRYSEGLHEVSVTATDAAGNAGEAATRQVYVTQLTAVDRSKLGLEDFLHYESTATGAGSRLHVNGANGNGVWHSTPVVNPGRGLSSVVNLTYNAQDRGGVLSQALSRGASPLIGATLQDLVGLAYGEAGHGFSLGISGVTRLNEPLGGALTANTTGVITLTDPDGTAHRFTGGLDGVFDEPKGVHLQLRRYASLTDVTSKRYWAATRPDGVTFFFDFTGYASSVEDRNGNVIRFDYERYSKIDGTPCPELDPLPELVCAKRVVRVVDPVGVDAGVDDVARNARSIRVTYRPGGVLRLPEGMDPAGIPDELAHIGGDAGRIASIRDHAGRLTEFTYDGDGYLTRLTQGKLQGATSHPDERSFELGYTGSGPNRVLHTVEDPNGHTSTIDYEALAEPGLLLTTRSIGRRVKWSEDRREARKDYAYAARSGGLPGTSFTVTDPALENETARRARSAQLDYQARPVELVDGRGTSTQLVWDEGTEFPDDNNVTTLVEAAGTADAATSTMKYNEHGQLTEQTDPLGRTSDLDYFTATAGTHIAPSGNDVGQAFVSDLEQITPPKGNWTKFTLDGAGNVTSKQVKDQPAAITTYGTRGIIASEKDEVGNVTQYQDHEANGLPRRTIDPRNHHWTYQYDAVGNVLKATDPRGSDTAAENDFAARITYDAFDRVTQTVTPKRSQHSEFVTRTSDYDGNGNLIERVDGEGESTLFGFTVMDEPSRQESAPAPHYGQQDASREVTTSEYDTLGRIRRRIAPNGDGGVEGDFETTFTYSAADELLVERRKAHANDQNTPAELVTSMAYDRRGNVVGVADARRNASAGAGADPVALAANPNARRWTYVYDLADNREEAIEDPGAAPKKSLRTTFTYDDNDNVETQTSPRGHAEERVSDFTTTFGHDTNDLVTSIQHKERLTTFERRGDGRISAQVAPRGNETADTTTDFKTTYDYYATGELLKWTLPRHKDQYGPSDRGVTYGRNAVGDPTTITDPRNQVATNTFYDSGELATTNRPSLWTSGKGDHEQDASLDPLAAERSNGHEIRLRTYDEWIRDEPGGDLPASEGHGDFGAVDPAEMPSLLPRAGATTFAYDDEMRLTSVTDAAGKVTQLQRDPVGRVVRELRPFDAGREDIKTEYAFDRNGNVRETIDGAGHRTTRQYDEYDRLIAQDAPGASETAPGVGGGGTVQGARTLTRYDANGNVTSTVTPRGTTERNAYDAVDRLEQATAADSAVTRYAYDENGNVETERRPRGEGEGDAHRWSTTFEYTDFDEVEKHTQTAWRAGSTEQSLITDYQYDRNGNEISVEAPGAGLSPSDPDSSAPRRVTTREFDGRDLPWTETVNATDGARTTTTEFDPNGNLRRTINPAGTGEAAPSADTTQEGAPSGDAGRHATVREFSPDNLLTTEWLPRSGSSDPAWRRGFGYDTRGRADKIVAPYHDDASRTTQSVYTRFETGWIKTASDQAHTTGDRYAEQSLFTYDYDRRGNQTTWQSASGRRVNRAYYPNGLLRERTARHSAEDTNPRNYTYGYNANRTLTQYVDWDLKRTTSLRQDAAERTTLVNEDWSGGRDTRMEYDKAGNVAKRWTDGQYSEDAEGNPVFAGGKRTEFSYDSLDREVSMTVVPTGQPNRVTTTNWWPSGEMRSRVKPNETTESWAYFENGSLRTMRRKAKNGGDIDQAYTYDKNLNRLTDERGTHEYNARDQLTTWIANGAHGGTTTTYEVNATGAITLEKTGDHHLRKNYTGDQLTSEEEHDGDGQWETTATFHHDTNGNLDIETRDNPSGEADLVTNYIYDPFNRLVGANGSGVKEPHVFAFDALDRRDWQCVRGATEPNCTGGTKREMGYVGTTNRVSSELLPLVAGEQTAKTATYDYTSAFEGVGQHDGTQYLAYATDANGSVVGLEDGNGAIKQNSEPGGGRQYRYNPYGELLGDRVGSQTNLDTVAERNPFRFEGFYYDAGIRSYDMQARQYMPRMGRFLSEDRFESAIGDFNLQSDHLTQNRYAFAGGNPVNDIEWDGHQTGHHADTKRARQIARARRLLIRAGHIPPSGRLSKREAEQFMDAYARNHQVEAHNWNVADRRRIFDCLTLRNAACGDQKISTAEPGWARTADQAMSVLALVPQGKGAAAARSLSLRLVGAGTAVATKRNYRKLFLAHVGKMPKGFQVHHALPQKYAKILARRGVNVHEVALLRGVRDTVHARITRDWARWERSLGRTPTSDEIVAKSYEIDEKFGRFFIFP